MENEHRALRSNLEPTLSGVDVVPLGTPEEGVGGGGGEGEGSDM